MKTLKINLTPEEVAALSGIFAMLEDMNKEKTILKDHYTNLKKSADTIWKKIAKELPKK